MENVISDYRTYLKKKFWKKINNARFYMDIDGHPIQYKLVREILSNDFHMTYSYVMANPSARQYYITGYLPSQKSVFTCNEEVEVADIK